MPFDIISIGSATVDVFVDVARGSEEFRKDRDHGHRDVCYAIGRKVLVKELYTSTGGSATNTAVAFARLGLRTGCVAKFGDDANSQTILDTLKKEKIAFLGKQGKGKSGFSVILVKLLGDRTILAYKGINDRLEQRDIQTKKLYNTRGFYFGTMLGKSWKTTSQICKTAKKKGIPYTFNPSFYLAKQGIKKLRPFLPGATLLVLNREEANAMLKTKGATPKALLKRLQKYSHFVIITDGPKAAHAYDGRTIYKLYQRDIKVIETTGAGDAFAAGVTAGLVKGWAFEKALQLGHAEAISVLRHIGAKEKLLNKREAAQMMKTFRAKRKKGVR